MIICDGVAMKFSIKTIGSELLWCGINSHNAYYLDDDGLRGSDLRGANLCGTNFSCSNLSSVCLDNADLRDSNFYCTKLHNANLRNTDLRGAYLSSANLHNANLRESDLSEANLHNAILQGACLSNTNLYRANLAYTDLRSTILTNANLTGTCLDPKAPVPELTDRDIIDAGLEIRGDRVYGWRTYVSKYVGSTRYEVGKEYQAPWFSVCQETECHPGLYLASMKWLLNKIRYMDEPAVRCYCRRDELIHAGDKWRAKRLWIVA
jgi:hypothetical protein